MSIFFDMLDDSNKVMYESSNDTPQELFMEAVNIELLPDIKLMRKKYTLPLGKPSGRGCLAYLYSNNIDESINMILHKNSPFEDRNKYKRYFFPLNYNFRVYNKKIMMRTLDERKGNYIKISANTSGFLSVNKPTFINSDGFNTYFDLYKYINLILKGCSNLPPSKFILEYWKIFKNILGATYPKYDTYYVLVDMSNFSLGTKLKENLKNPLFMMYYTLLRNWNLIKDFNMDFYFYNGNKSLKINPAKTNEKSYIDVRREMKKLVDGISSQARHVDIATSDESIHNDEILDESRDTILTSIQDKNDKIIKSDEDFKDTSTNKEIDSKITNIVSKSDKIIKDTIITNANTLNATIKSDVPKKPIEKIEDIIPSEDGGSSKEIEKKDVEIISNAVKDKAEDLISEDKELLEKIYDDIQKDKPKVTFSSERDKLLRQEQKKIMLDDMTLESIAKINSNNIKIEEKDISSVLSTPNDDLKTVRYENFKKTYNEKLMKKDIVNAITSLNDKSIPMYIIKIDRQDTSDSLNYKDTYTILLEDENRKRHTIKVDIPKFMEDKFLYIGGNKKIIKNQNMFYPVVKVSENTVHVVTNYSKIIIHRNERKSLSAIERFKSMINKYPEFSKCLSFGNVIADNKEYVTTLEYDELSKLITEFKNNKTHIIFNQAIIHSKEYPHKNGYMCIGTENSQPIYIDTETQKDNKDRSIIDIILDAMPEDYRDEYQKIKQPKILASAVGRIMDQDVKIGILLAFWEGFTSLIKKLDVNYTLENKVPSNLPPTKSYIKFKDCVFVYDNRVDVSLLLNGFSDMDTANINLIDMDDRVSYVDYLIKRYGNATIENALMNFYDFMLDPITKEVCIDRSFPTDIVGLIIYAVKLLGDSQHQLEINQSNYRIRSNEIVPAILYSNISRGYLQYRNSSGRKKFSVKQDCVIKELLAQKTVENYSTLNPFLEMQISSAVSSKGYRGSNQDRAYTLQKRMYDESMIGTISPVTSPDANAGISKYLSVEPNVSGMRGYVNIPENKDYSKLTDINLFSGAELCIPLGDALDDPTRLGHLIFG